MRCMSLDEVKGTREVGGGSLASCTCMHDYSDRFVDSLVSNAFELALAAG